MIAVLKNHDHYPAHYLLHLLHGAEIVGYKHPGPRDAPACGTGSTPTLSLLPRLPRNRMTTGQPAGCLRGQVRRQREDRMRISNSPKPGKSSTSTVAPMPWPRSWSSPAWKNARIAWPCSLGPPTTAPAPQESCG